MVRTPRFAQLLPAALLLTVAAAIGGCSGCDEDAVKKPTAASGKLPGGLTPELAAKPLAKVGDRVITLGEYAAAIERMDQFERLRYQSPERRKLLLEEMIKVELLANEARKRGLDKQPKTKARLRILLRDELLKDARSKVPGPSELSEAEVRKYYDSHRDEFREPERRRVSHIVVKDEATAKRVLEEAKKASAAAWGKLVAEHSLDKPPTATASAPLELAGDLGIVSAPGSKKGENPKIPEAVRAAVFKIAKIGDVYSEVVAADGKFHLVRMTGKTEARDRTYSEAERTIRVALVQAKIAEAERKLEADLRKKYKVVVDDAALSRVKVPALGSAVPSSSAGSTPASPAPSASK